MTTLFVNKEKKFDKEKQQKLDRKLIKFYEHSQKKLRDWISTLEKIYTEVIMNLNQRKSGFEKFRDHPATIRNFDHEVRRPT